MITTIRAISLATPAPGARRHLAENQATVLPRGRRATVVRVERGTVLVTQEGDLDDHVLEPGDELVLRRGGRAVAWAFTEAIISARDARDDEDPRRPDAG